MIQLTERTDGIVLPVRAQPGAGQDGVRGVQNGALKVAVTQIAEKGKANKAILRLLAKSLRLRRSQVTLISGETSADKKVLVQQVDLDDLHRRLRNVCRDAN